MAEEPTGGQNHDTIDALMAENRRFPPSEEFKANSLVTGTFLYDEAAEDDEGFWARQAADLLDWAEPWHTTLDWQIPERALVRRRHVERRVQLPRPARARRQGRQGRHPLGGRARRHAHDHVPELLDEVSRFANVLTSLGVAKGDRVNIYLPMIPEAAVAMLACARIGAPHSVVFGGFSSQSLADRINDAEAKVLVTADGGYRRGSVFPLKAAADEACASAPSIEHVVVVRRGGNDVEMVEGRDHWYHDLMADASADCPAEPMEAEHLLFLLYTSGTTGKPKGIMHTTGGYLTHVAYTHKYVFDLHPDTDVFWCTADVGWVTGHSYIVYGPLANGATQVMYEGVPNHPDNDRFWEIVEKYGVTILYTAPTAIRTFMKWGDAEPAKHDLSSLRLLGSVGEPINPEAWMWYQEHIGGGRCPIVDTWWQTETGGIMISPLPGATTTKPGSATFPLPGVSAELVDDQERHVEVGGGYLTLTRPWPGMLRGIWGDPERFQETYWSRFPGRYFAGDGAKLDDDGYLWLLGRVDDVMNVSGHRISTTEVESALVSHPSVAEAAVVGATDCDDRAGDHRLRHPARRQGRDEQDLRDHVATEIGAIAKPKTIYLTPDLPKTRSGKIMRRLLRDVAEGRNIGDTTDARRRVDRRRAAGEGGDRVGGLTLPSRRGPDSRSRPQDRGRRCRPRPHRLPNQPTEPVRVSRGNSGTAAECRRLRPSASR